MRYKFQILVIWVIIVLTSCNPSIYSPNRIEPTKGLFDPIWVDYGAENYIIQGTYIIRLNNNNAEIIDRTKTAFPTQTINNFIGCSNGIVYSYDNDRKVVVQHISGYEYNSSEFDLRCLEIEKSKSDFKSDYHYINDNYSTIVNQQGWIIFEGNFSSIGNNPFGEILIYGVNGTECGFITTDNIFNKIGVDAYVDPSGFCDGYALVQISNGLFKTQSTYLSKENMILIPSSYDGLNPAIYYFNEAKPFSEKLAAVQIGNLWGYIDTKGDIVIPPQYKYAGAFQNGKAIVETTDNLLGQITPSNKLIKPWINIKGYHFVSYTDGFYCIQSTSTPFEQTLISEEGEFILDKLYSNITMNSGIWCLRKEHDSHIYLYFPISNKIIATWELPRYSYNESTVIRYRETDYLLNSKTGEVLFSADEILDFEEGLAPFRSNNLWGYIDYEGRVIFSPQFKQAGAFSHALAIVSNDERMGIIVNPLVYSNITEWDSSTAGRIKSFGLSDNIGLIKKDFLSKDDIKYLIDQINIFGEEHSQITSMKNFSLNDVEMQTPINIGQFCNVLSSIAEQNGIAIHRFLYPSNVGGNSKYQDDIAFCAATGILNVSCSEFDSEHILSGADAMEMTLRLIEVII